jgi:hypothetical protein
MTAAQARRIIASVLPLKSLTPQGALEIIAYHTRRNDVAYKSHRKAVLEVAAALGIKMSL